MYYSSTIKEVCVLIVCTRSDFSACDIMSKDHHPLTLDNLC